MPAPLEGDNSAASFYKTLDKGVEHIRVAYVLEVPELEKALDALERGRSAYPSPLKIN